MKKLMCLLAFSIICSSCTAFASESETNETKNSPTTQYFLDHFAGNMELSNNYVFRGISQTREEPAVQGGLTYNFDNKIYLAIWGSNVNFYSLTGQQATLETDEVIGYANSIKDFNYDIHLVTYIYPRASSANYPEAIGSISYHFITFLMGYSSNVFTSHGPGTYANLGLNFEIPQKYVYFDKVKLSGGIGNYNLNRRAGYSYHDYNIQIAKGIGDTYILSLQWVNTNHKNPPYDGSQIVATLTANF